MARTIESLEITEGMKQAGVRQLAFGTDPHEIVGRIYKAMLGARPRADRNMYMRLYMREYRRKVKAKAGVEP